MWLINSVKGFFGNEDIKVESGGQNEETTTGSPSKEKEGLWQQLRGMIGKDVTSMISLPVWIFEPLSFLQIMCEPMQNAELLFKAAKSEDSAERMAYLVAFIAAGYSYATRSKKPFNPILGETFEFLSKEQNWKFFAEQVSHHPPIGVSEATSEEFRLNLEMGLKTAFRGNSSEVFVDGTNHCTFLKHDEHISWSHLQSCAHNVIIGSMWVDHFGTLELTNHKTKEVGKIVFSKSGWLGAGRFDISGFVNTAEGKPKLKVFGKWNGQIFCQSCNEAGEVTGEPKLLWEKEKPYANKWNFPSVFTENLNHFDEEYKKVLPPTDSRLRTDRYWLEKGDSDKASKEKHRLEEKQRTDKKERAAKGITYEPRYFKKVDEPEQVWKSRWEKIRDYWVDQKERLSQPQEQPLKSEEGKQEVHNSPEIPIEKMTLKEN